MRKRLDTQLKNAEEIRRVLNKINIRFKYNSKSIETLLVYLPCNNGVCDHSDLFSLIKKNLMTNFVLSFREIENKLSIRSKKTADDLFKKSVRKMSKHTAQGELGELLLFTLLEVYFDAPKILSKISHKTSRRVPVHGADAVHAQFIEDKLRLYLGESKIHKKFTSAASKAVVSISSAVEKYSDEFDLIDSYIDFPKMDDETRSELLDFLNPFKEDNDIDYEFLHSPCFIGFLKPEIFCDDVECYKKKYIKIAKSYIENFYSKLEKKADISKTALLLLPFSSIEDLVNEFTEYMGIAK